MTARKFWGVAFLLIVIALVLLGIFFGVGYAFPEDRCEDGFDYTSEIPVVAGQENAYDILLGTDEVVCQTFMWSDDGSMYHFGQDQQSECQDGLCVNGTEMGKYFNDGKFSFWWEEFRPTKVVVHIREYWEFETPHPETPTPTPTQVGPNQPNPTATPHPTPIISPPWPKKKFFLALVFGN